MAFENEPGEGAISQINVTPLVDVMLVLLVIFMVTAPILQQGVDVQLSQVQAAPLAGDGDEWIVAVDATGGVFLNESATDLGELTTKLTAAVAADPERQVFLRADRDVPYGEVMRVVAQMRAAGVVRLGMITEPPADDIG